MTVEINDFLVPASSLEEKQGRVFETCLSLDIALNGGIPEGCNCLLSGVPKVGKTTLALHFVEKCMIEDPEKKCFFFDVEGRLRTDLLDCFPGIDKDRFFVIKSNEVKILAAEDYLNLIINTLKDNNKCIVILDSVAALCPESELSSNIGDSVKMAGIASLMYKLFRKTSQILGVSQATFIALTHLVANPNPGPGKKSFDVGGNANRYGASVWLQAAWKKNIEEGEGNIVGQHAMFVVNASALGPPTAKVEIPIIYGKGIDSNLDLLNVALEFGLIKKAGGWYTITVDGEDTKFHGQKKMMQYLESDLETAATLEKNIREMVFGETHESTTSGQSD